VRWLLDEMLPPLAAAELVSKGHDAVSVIDLGMAGVEDTDIFDRAVLENRVLVTENFGDFAMLVAQRLSREERCVPVVFVRRENLPKRGALAVQLALLLDRWATVNREPYVGIHWA
jgi:predicted nuclease of predicted toxin-antitoxin system